jgi:hypothetical protein
MSRVIYIMYFFLLLSVYIFAHHNVEERTRKTVHLITLIFILSYLCVLNFMLPSCRPNLAEAARTAQKGE